jgi:uncharacterized Zn ribbon protein
MARPAVGIRRSLFSGAALTCEHDHDIDCRIGGMSLTRLFVKKV